MDVGVIFPASMQDSKPVTICEKDGFKLEVVPTWPCYAKDGAGKITNFWFKLTYTDTHGNIFIVEQPEKEE